MNRLSRLLLTLGLALSLLFTGIDASFAARMGGGKSFGSRPSYSQPYKSPNNGYSQATPAQPGYQSPAYQRNQAARESLSRRGGLMGMLGGLALGGLLGAMLFGGAFEHINFVDLLIFAGIAFLLFKLLASRRHGGSAHAAAGNYRAEPGSDFERGYERRAEPVYAGPANRAGFDTDILSRKGRNLGVGVDAIPHAPAALPSDFDKTAFLSGAKAAYAHLQAAWDAADLAELRALTTDKVFCELQEQLRERGGANHTELLEVEATVLDVRDQGDERTASVLYDVLMREAPGAEAVRVREAWHFVRSRSSRQPTWYLDGIQQLED
ncbi:Tim44 domain-containing protein [Methylococcus sp. EFPC2]|uniref:Tim44 domain-containing protein n=1 Tax=Methylococcus sp. EFPC2 TaxID=2812648 RepID=UPI001967CF39|nr:Tim44-like domain-containing protein [Methylococcus sp. EFPC2]QSA97972.1 Tim44 domain-containing protein [Methylococcus sp. EFPC2]